MIVTLLLLVTIGEIISDSSSDSMQTGFEHCEEKLIRSTCNRWSSQPSFNHEDYRLPSGSSGVPDYA